MDKLDNYVFFFSSFWVQDFVKYHQNPHLALSGNLDHWLKTHEQNHDRHQ